MNYLPMAATPAAPILDADQSGVDREAGGRRLAHTRPARERTPATATDFTLDAGEVVLSAGSLNSTEILLRSEMHGLSVSPALGTKFSGNGDFFGLAYDGYYETDVLGYRTASGPARRFAGTRTEHRRPGPIHRGRPRSPAHRGGGFLLPQHLRRGRQSRLRRRFAGRTPSPATKPAQPARLAPTSTPRPRHDPNGALNHSMLYLVMGQDNARGVILFDSAAAGARWHASSISWDQAGQQQIFTRMNEELRRHAHALRANFISNPPGASSSWRT